LLMSGAAFGPYEYIGWFITVLLLHWGVLWFVFFRRFFTAALAGHPAPKYHWIVWTSVAFGIIVTYAAVVYAARVGGFDRTWLADVAIAILFVTNVDLVVLAVRLNRSRSRETR